MNWDLLFKMQDELDQRIKQEHQLENTDVVHEKILALLVEVGELANETRCFKFWSHKGPNDHAAILEEYVDGLHFIISLGLELGFSYEGSRNEVQESLASTSDEFLQVYENTIALKNKQTEAAYEQLFHSFLVLGEGLGFEEEMIKRAYVNKNEVNHQRQDTGY
ncbi:Dimeric dUTPase, all-alpha-NTP-PPase (MazG) superfamily [Salinibacillus kushneri]|uniref:Dimeric dUTPase, all-alpha-NTP-PPase (MazG) superfamily n=1 Tax=Salinibacillus kushneri TaxID=237682 RepID=A0A1I0H6Q3_9BACI|nr:dUTP diphosphatase [Salinibacillus kushneri]SET78502.1 Dimeric dUTPase, all-alpha-NTP-PPase (MazG) superfamily [Salinibacillus kushneri]